MSLSLDASRSSVKETAATIYYSATFSGIPSKAYNISYSGSILCKSVSNADLIWSKSVDSNISSGSVYFSNLSTGESYIISSNGITCSYNYDTEVPSTDPETGEPITTIVTNSGSASSGSNSITIYTHPGSFSFGATNDPQDSKSIIANVLSADYINKKWILHFQDVYHWYTQDGDDYVASGLTVKSGDPITAEWFKNCLTAMNAVGKNYPVEDINKIKGGSDGTIISADLINKLNFSGIT